MRVSKKIKLNLIAIGLIIAPVLLCFLGVVVSGAALSRCERKILTENLSPDKSRVAVVYQQNYILGGNTAVSIYQAKRLFTRLGTEIVYCAVGAKTIETTWKDDMHLQINVSGRLEKVVELKEQMGDITIEVIGP